MLLGARGFFASSVQVDRPEFHAYVENLELRQRYPGIQGIGLSLWLPPAGLAAHEAEVRASGFPDYRVWPEGARDVYTSVVYLEPLDWRNQRALGFDMFSEPIRREAMRRALEGGVPAASGKVRLVQESNVEPQSGFLLYVPLYTGPVPATPEARRAALRGFVYAPFRMGDLIEGLRFPGFQSAIDLRIHDGEGAGAESLLYASAEAHPAPGPRLSQWVPLEVAGRRWTLVFTAREAFVQDAARVQVLSVVAGGLLLSLLLFLITRSQVNARAAAEAASRVQQRLAAEAQAAVRVRDEFLGVAAHELRTPLTSLSLQVQLLRKQLGRDGSVEADKLKRSVALAERQTARLAQLVDSLLDISRLTHGRLELNLEELDLAEVARAVVHRFETEARLLDVALTVDAPEPVRGRWDRLRLEQVVTNLVDNAVKYGEGRPVAVKVEGTADGVRLTVRDEGIGIDPEALPRLFGRFERAVSERHYGGLGLGLYITRTLVESMGGQVRVESEPGQGSTFTVELPRESPTPSK
jgi:signal transduction histidine kinase